MGLGEAPTRLSGRLPLPALPACPPASDSGLPWELVPARLSTQLCAPRPLHCAQSLLASEGEGGRRRRRRPAPRDLPRRLLRLPAGRPARRCGWRGSGERAALGRLAGQAGRKGRRRCACVPLAHSPRLLGRVGAKKRGRSRPAAPGRWKAARRRRAALCLPLRRGGRPAGLGGFCWRREGTGRAAALSLLSLPEASVARSPRVAPQGKPGRVLREPAARALRPVAFRAPPARRASLGGWAGGRGRREGPAQETASGQPGSGA